MADGPAGPVQAGVTDGVVPAPAAAVAADTPPPGTTAIVTPTDATTEPAGAVDEILRGCVGVFFWLK